MSATVTPSSTTSAGGRRGSGSDDPSHIVRFVFYTDFPSNSIVKVVGSAPELGSWNVPAGAVLRYEEGTQSFVGSVQLGPTFTADPSASKVDFEYKIIVKKPVDSRTATWHEDSWEWQPGPNRRASLPKKRDTATSTSAISKGMKSQVLPHVIRETWYHARDGTQVIDSDGYLEPHRGHLQHRYKMFTEALAAIDAHGGGLDHFSRGWEHYGFTHGTIPSGGTGITFREWAPGAVSAALVGEFNGWDTNKNPCTKDDFGVFTCYLADLPDGSHAIPHNTLVKISFVLQSGERVYRIPAWIRYAVYQKEVNEYCGKYWNPPAGERHVWKHQRQHTFCAADYGRVPGIEPIPATTEETASPTNAADHGFLESKGETPHRRGLTGMDGVKVASRATKFVRAEPSSRPVAYDLDVSGDPAAAGLRVYEAHVGMGTAEERVCTYREFADNVLPRIKKLGYNCVQLMAIMEHAYYGSFGYHVTSFLAPSSRFGTPEDLKYLVDAAHGMGLIIIMDLVHSHAAKNVNDGINMFDGTDHHYFHGGPRGNHDLWDSRLFDYSKFEVQRFLLSSARLFIEEFRFDGYRFDGVTSMMYLHHGLSYGFSGGYHEYFGSHTDVAAVVYLMLVNHMLHACTPPAMSIAEDVSGMPTLCRPVWEGGVGFDYRLGMAIPDKWIKLLKESRDEDWNLADIAFTLTNRRWQEKTIAYAESHDQALVGDKTLAFWLMDKEMYWHMSSLEKPVHPVVDRGLSLHKMIRLITYGLGGEGYLNFMGNEFGHPEWIDFPREGNNWSYKHCRRQWNLVDDDTLHYKNLNNFDAAMHHLEDEYPWLVSHDLYISLKHDSDKVLVFDRNTSNGPLVFIFNFHPTNSFTDYKIGVPASGEWEVALDSDWSSFGGYDRVDRRTKFFSDSLGWNDRPFSLQVYTPCRTVQVLKLVKKT